MIIPMRDDLLTKVNHLSFVLFFAVKACGELGFTAENFRSKPLLLPFEAVIRTSA